MELVSARATALEVWIRDNPNERSQFEKARVTLNGQDVFLDVWRIPIKFLIYNIRNGRFASELLAKEKDLRRTLDPATAEDKRIIQEILLSQKPEETAALKKNISEHGQIDYGIVTFDGAVINANRRMAIISALFEETRDTKFQYLRAAILPKNVHPQDLWRIEAGIQFGEDFILDYAPINELLKLREGINQGLNPQDIESTLRGRYTIKDIQTKLQILKLIDSYLEFIGRPNEYSLIQEERSIEKFNSLQKNVIDSLRAQGINPSELHEIILVAFSLIKTEDITHWRIRKLKEIAQNSKAKAMLVKNYNFTDPAKTDLANLSDSFETAEEILRNKENEDKPVQLLRKAFEALCVIDEKNTKLKDKEIAKLIANIEGQLTRLKSGM